MTNPHGLTSQGPLRTRGVVRRDEYERVRFARLIRSKRKEMREWGFSQVDIREEIDRMKAIRAALGDA